MKICGKCKTEKPEVEFAWKNKTNGLRHGTCKSCHREYTAGHYAENKAKYIASAKKNSPKYLAENKAWLIEYLKSHSCVDCGESDINVLEFDHIIPVGTKALRVTAFMSSRSGMIREIEKCEVRCANCHTRRTRKMQGWWRE